MFWLGSAFRFMIQCNENECKKGKNMLYVGPESHMDELFLLAVSFYKIFLSLHLPENGMEARRHFFIIMSLLLFVS